MDEDDEVMEKESDAQDGKEASNPLAEAINHAQAANSREPEEDEQDEEDEDMETAETEKDTPFCMQDSENSPLQNSPLQMRLRQKPIAQSSSTSKYMASPRYRSTASNKNKKTRKAIHPASIAEGADLLFV